jgi:hypothetical protein
VVDAHFEIWPGREVVRERPEGDGWLLCLQYGELVYPDGARQRGYRFMWRKPDGKLNPVLGGAIIPSSDMLLDLVRMAARDGWLVRCEGEHREVELGAVSVPDQDPDIYSREG